MILDPLSLQNGNSPGQVVLLDALSAFAPDLKFIQILSTTETMKISHPLAQEILDLMQKLDDPNGLAPEDLARLTSLTREMNRLNPNFAVLEFVEQPPESD
jgi:hypothetical protein